MTTANVGYGFLRPHLTRDEWENTPYRVKNVTNIALLKSYMCTKSHGDPEICRTCPGKETCTAGQRAIEIVDQDFVRVWTDKDSPTQEQPKPPNQIKVTEDRETFRKACESGNAWNYLMSEFGMSKGAAKEKLVFWADHYKDIAAEFGGKTRLLAKPKAVTVIASTPPEQHTENVVVVDEPVPELAKETKQPEKGATQRSRGREHCRLAIESGDPIAYLVAEGKERRQALKHLWFWKKSYPDMFSQEETAAKKEEPVEDEVSLADFLKEQGEPEKAQESPQDSFLATLNAKYEELKAEYEETLETIKKAEERSKWLESKMDALAQTLSVFRGE